MTDKQIIIDTTKCIYNTFDGGGSQRTICILDDNFCDCLRDRDCYYKQLKRAEQECENNKIAYQMEVDIYNQECLNLQEELKAKEQECKKLLEFNNSLVEEHKTIGNDLYKEIKEYRKKLQAKEQECEELKIYIESNEQQVKEVETLVMDNDRLINELDQLKSENEELKEQLTILNDEDVVVEITVKQFEEYKKLKETNEDLLSIQYKLADNNKQLRQTLAEIKELCQKHIKAEKIVTANDILQKISECEEK